MKLSGLLCVLCFSTLSTIVLCQEVGDAEKVYEWIVLDYDWLSEEDRDEAIQNGDYIVENNVICGIKVYNGEVYVTVPRWLQGVPSTLNKVIMKEGEPILQPWPSWEMQEKDNCDVLQFIQSMEIDPHSGQMWAIDTGRRDINVPGGSIDNCPPKLVILEMDTGEIIHTHIFPDDVLSHTGNHFNDIVVDLHHGHAYMTDTGTSPNDHRGGGIIVYDYSQDRSRRLEHPSMAPEFPDGPWIEINGESYFFPTPSDGIALSPDGMDVFYTPLGGYNLWRLPTEIARDFDIENIDPYLQNLGPKVSQSDGLAMGHQNLYYGALSMNSVWMWEYQKDMEDNDGNWTMATETMLAHDDAEMIWPDTLAFDDEGWLWYTPNKLALFFAGELNISAPISNNFVWKVFVDDASYLYP